jgi:hypothetical protein
MTDPAAWRASFPALLERVGRTLYGDAWRAALARALPGPEDAAHHRLRTVERWFAGTRAPRSPAVLDELAQVATARADELETQAKAARLEAQRLARLAVAAQAADTEAGRPPAAGGRTADVSIQTLTDKQAAR